MLKFLISIDVRVNITVDDVRLKSNLTTKKKQQSLLKGLFLNNTKFRRIHWGELGDIDGFVQIIPGTSKGDKPINITSIDKVHLKCDCIKGSIVNGA